MTSTSYTRSGSHPWTCWLLSGLMFQPFLDHLFFFFFINLRCLKLKRFWFDKLRPPLVRKSSPPLFLVAAYYPPLCFASVRVFPHKGYRETKPPPPPSRWMCCMCEIRCPRCDLMISVLYVPSVYTCAEGCVFPPVSGCVYVSEWILRSAALMTPANCSLSGGLSAHIIESKGEVCESNALRLLVRALSLSLSL